MMTLLQLVQTVADELGLNRPTVVMAAVDAQTRQFLALLNRLGADLTRQYDWQGLDKEHVFSTVSYTRTGTITEGSAVVTATDTTGLSARFGLVAEGIAPFAQITTVDSPTQCTMNMPATQTGTISIQYSQVEYPFPSDWGKPLNDTGWDRTNRWPLLGPKSPQEWQNFKSGIVYAGPRERFRLLHNAFAINPPPPNGLTFALEYISKGFVIDATTGANKAAFTNDNDTTIYRDSLLITGLKSMWKAAKGLDNSFDIGEFRDILETEKSQNNGAATLSLSPNIGTVLMTNAQIQDGNWPG
jgi:hypothetical protein